LFVLAGDRGIETRWA